MKKNIQDLFAGVPDSRVVNRCSHKLSDILFIALSTLICNGEDFEDMVEFAHQRYDWLSTILELPDGIPSQDTFNRVLQRIEPKALQKCLSEDGQVLLDTLNEKQINLDGKKIRGVWPTSKGNNGLYILSAWVNENNLCVGQSRVEDKSNEITAIPELLDTLHIQGATISIDAIGCQKAIAAKIVDKQAEYLLSLKKNHWSIENQLHWHLDVTFGEDASRARLQNAPENLNILRKIALQRITQMKDKLSKKKRRYRASLNNDYLKQVLNI